MKLKNLIAGVCVLCGFAVSAADGSVRIDEVGLHAPWDGKIDVSYTLGGIDSGIDYRVEFAVTAAGMTAAVTNEAARLENKGYVQTIDTVALFGKETIDRKAKVGISLVAIRPVVMADGLYMVIDLTEKDGKYAVTYADEPPANAPNWNTDTYKSDKLVLRRIAANASYPYCQPEPTAYPISSTLPVKKDYWIGVFPVTGAQYDKVTGAGTSGYDPVVDLGYSVIRGTVQPSATPSAASFFGKLSAKCVDSAGRGVAGFDLPTDAQWEIACRAGTSTKFSCGDTLTDEYAIFNLELNQQWDPRNVGQKKPNPWGLFDMHGNACEYCRDIYSGSYAATAAEDYCTSGMSSTTYVTRGGGWYYAEAMCASSHRGSNSGGTEPFYGFRLARTAD